MCAGTWELVLERLGRNIVPRYKWNAFIAMNLSQGPTSPVFSGANMCTRVGRKGMMQYLNVAEAPKVSAIHFEISARGKICWASRLRMAQN
jgi:hypothetical protein